MPKPPRKPQPLVRRRRAFVPTQRRVAPVLVKPVRPPAKRMRNVLRPIAKPLAPARVPTQRVAARVLVKPVAPPVKRMRNVLRPVAKPLAPMNVPVQRIVSSHPFAANRTTQRLSVGTLVPPIQPPVPVIRQGIVTERVQAAAAADLAALRAEAAVHALVPSASAAVPVGIVPAAVPVAEAAAAQALLEDLLADIYGDEPAYFRSQGPARHGFLRMGPILKGRHYGRAHGRGHGRGYGADLLRASDTANAKYKVTSYGWVWRYDYFNPSDDDDITVVYNGSTEDPGWAYAIGTESANNIKAATVAAFGTYSAAKARADALIKTSGTAPSTSSKPPAPSSSPTSSIPSAAATTSSSSVYTLTPVAIPAGANFSTIKSGSTDKESGGAVSWVSARLGLITRSFYDAVMSSAVRAFQSDNNLTVDGIVGSKTYAALGYTKPSSSSSSSTYKPSTSSAGGAAVSLPADTQKESGFKALTSKPWFWPVAILAPTTLIVGGILLWPTGKKAPAAAAPAAATPVPAA